jgi:hypothetical protein
MQRLETNALVVRYQDLVLRTREVVATIALQLGLQDDVFDISLANPSSVGRYREEQVEAIERRAGAMLEAWGYTPGVRA